MSKFRKKFLSEAVQWTGNNLEEIIQFTDGRRPQSGDPHIGDRWEEYEALVAREGLKIFTLEGPLMAQIGDWILKGIKGECWPVKPDIFAATYEMTTRVESSCSHCRDLLASLTHCQQEKEQLTAAIKWALGEEGEFGEEPEPLAGKYRRRFWWRTELRDRAFGPMTGRAGMSLRPGGDVHEDQP